jgi:hypothetical protein
MQMLYLGADSAGVSHFEDRELRFSLADFAPPAPPMGVSEAIEAQTLLFLDLPAGWSDAAHCSPCRQVALCLSGRMRVRAGDGEERIIEPGGIWQMEDTSGGGHASAVIGDQPVRLAIIQLT